MDFLTFLPMIIPTIACIEGFLIFNFFGCDLEVIRSEIDDFSVCPVYYEIFSFLNRVFLKNRTDCRFLFVFALESGIELDESDFGLGIDLVFLPLELIFVLFFVLMYILHNI